MSHSTHIAASIVRKVLGLFGICVIVLGAHGIYVHFTRMTTYSIEEIINGFPSQGKLFTVIPVGPVDGIVNWMSDLGFESWVLPVLIGILGFAIFRYRKQLVFAVFRT